MCNIVFLCMETNSKACRFVSESHRNTGSCFHASLYISSNCVRRCIKLASNYLNDLTDSSVCKAGTMTRIFLFLCWLPVILVAAQQMAGWWCCRSDHTAPSSDLCPSLQTPAVPRRWLIISCSSHKLVIRGMGTCGVFCCCCSYRDGLRLFPPA